MIKIIHDGENIVVDFEGNLEDVITHFASAISFAMVDIAEKANAEPHKFVNDFLKSYKKSSNSLIKKILDYKEDVNKI